MSKVDPRRLEAIEASIPPRPPPVEADQEWLHHLTEGEFRRLEAALEAVAHDGDGAAAAVNEAHLRARARLLTGVDVKLLSDREFHARVLVPIPADEPPMPGRTRLVGYMPDMVHPDVWHIEPDYAGRLPRTLTTAALIELDPQPWPPRVRP